MHNAGSMRLKINSPSVGKRCVNIEIYLQRFVSIGLGIKSTQL